MRGPDDVLSQALRFLRRAGVRISGGDLDDLSLVLADGTAKSVAVKMSFSGLTPSKISIDRSRRLDSTTILYVVPKAGNTVLEAARKGHVDLVALDPAQVIIGAQTLLGEDNEATELASHPRRGKTPWGRLAVERSLALTSEALDQSEIARYAGITQQAVSGALKNLSDYSVRGQHGWMAKDRPALIDHWLSLYPGPGGAATYWYSLDSVSEQARRAVELASALGAAPLVSGDAAADLLAPWRLPSGAHLYLREAVDFTDAGFSPAGPDEATLTAVIPEDRSLWTVIALLPLNRTLPLADPLIVLWDVLRSRGPDALEAADKLRTAIGTSDMTMKGSG